MGKFYGFANNIEITNNFVTASTSTGGNTLKYIIKDQKIQLSYEDLGS